MDENVTRVIAVINDGPHGSERAYNAMRLAMNLGKRQPGARAHQAAVQLLLVGHGVVCAKVG